jgi:hypothetical protein
MVCRRNGKVVHETQYFADPFEAPVLAQPMGSADRMTPHATRDE